MIRAARQSSFEPILQTEASECGLACLAMIAQHYGNRSGLAELRKRHSVSLKGTSLSQLIAIANDLGMSSRPLRVDLERLPELKLPCVLHWDFNHFVVLLSVEGDTAEIVDPAIGHRRLPLSEVSRSFTGVALELEPTPSFQRVDASESVTLRDLTGPVRGLTGAVSLVLFLSLALQALMLLTPFFLQWVVDEVLVAGDVDLLYVLGTGFLLLLVFQGATSYLRGRAVADISTRLASQWPARTVAHLLRLPLAYFEKRHIGDLVSRLASTGAIQRTLTTSFVESIVDGITVAATLLLMLAYSWKLAVISVLAASLYLALRWVAFEPQKRATAQQLVASAKQQSHLMETLRGIQTVKATGQEASRQAHWRNLLVATTNLDLKVAIQRLSFRVASQMVFGAERLGVIFFGAMFALAGELTVGMLMAFLAYKEQFSSRVASLIDAGIEYRMLRVHFERLADIALSEPEAQDPAAQGTSTLTPSISVSGLSFRYSKGEPWVIKDCSFEVAAGESVAIAGPSGCGKTTLLKLLLGLLEPEEGTIAIGGVPLSSLSKREFRSAFAGSVMQEDRLFHGSIADNIASFDSDVSIDDVERAAQDAQIHADIEAMPMGYHSLIGDMGTSLSGGQKQRVILARALYRRPKLLLLDEATSHLDLRHERLVSDSVRRLSITRVIVAHRLETIASADRVLAMSKGFVTEHATSEFMNRQEERAGASALKA